VPGLDFSRLTGPSAADTKIHPRDIFAALPARSSRYEYLRDVQREVFDAWHERWFPLWFPEIPIKINIPSDLVGATGFEPVTPRL
jgi:hypothetical protein